MYMPIRTHLQARLHAVHSDDRGRCTFLQTLCMLQN